MSGVNTASNESQIATYLANQGLPAVDIAGFLGNFQQESNFDTTAYNPREGAIGIAQWEGGRRSNGLDVYTTQHGGSETDLSNQLGYLTQELTGSESGTMAALAGVTDPAQAGQIVDADFERSEDTPGSTGRLQRMNNASQIYQQLTTGQTLTGGQSLTLTPGGATVADTGSGGAPSSSGPLTPGSPTSVTAGAAPAAFTAQPAGIFSSITGPVVKFALTGMFIVGGLGLVVLGVFRVSAPARKDATAAATSVPITA